MSFELSTDNQLYYRLEGRETVDVDAYEMLRRNDVRYILSPTMSQLDSDRTLCYTTDDLMPASDFLAQHVVNTQELIAILSGANEAFIEAHDYMLDTHSFAGSLYYLYLDEQLNSRLAYVPILGYVGCLGVQDFLNDVFVHMRYDMATGDRDCLVAIHEALRQKEDFSSMRFRKLLSALRLGRRPGEHVSGFVAGASAGGSARRAPVAGGMAGVAPGVAVATAAGAAAGGAAAGATVARAGGAGAAVVGAGRQSGVAAGRAAAGAVGQQGFAAGASQASRSNDAADNSATDAASSPDAPAANAAAGDGRFADMAVPGAAAMAAGMTVPSSGIAQGDSSNKKDKKSKKDKDKDKNKDSGKGKGIAGLFGRKGSDKGSDAEGDDAANVVPNKRRGPFGLGGKGKQEEAPGANDVDGELSEAPSGRRGRFGRKAKGAAADEQVASASELAAASTVTVAADAPEAKASHNFVPYAATVLAGAAVWALFLTLSGNVAAANGASVIVGPIMLVMGAPVIGGALLAVLVALLVFQLVFIRGLAHDVSVACAADGKGDAPSTILFVLFGILLPAGIIYGIIQRVRLGARIKANAASFGVDVGFFGGALVLLCEIIGILTLGIGSSIGMFFMVNNGDALIGAYNAARGE